MQPGWRHRAQLLTSDAKIRRAQNCGTGARCIQSCCMGTRAIAIAKVISNAYFAQLRGGRINQLALAQNAGNLLNPAARGLGGQAAVMRQKNSIMTRVLEIYLIVLDPSFLITSGDPLPNGKLNER